MSALQLPRVVVLEKSEMRTDPKREPIPKGLYLSAQGSLADSVAGLEDTIPKGLQNHRSFLFRGHPPGEHPAIPSLSV